MVFPGCFYVMVGPVLLDPWVSHCLIVKVWKRYWYAFLVVNTPLCPGKNPYFSPCLPPFLPVFYPPFGCCCPTLLLLVLMCLYRCPPPVLLLLILSVPRYWFGPPFLCLLLQPDPKLWLCYFLLCWQLALILLWNYPGPCPNFPPFLHITLAVVLPCYFF